ncbi:MAG: hypothetical protein CVT89_05710, partial [Candidatus Altiarchaeales archaeon HGW-Altiarchaeales-2]
MKIHKEGYEYYLKWINETDKYMKVICLESVVNVLLNINSKRDIKEIQKVTQVKSLMTIYNTINNLSELHLVELKKEKPSHSTLGMAVKVKILELEQLMKTKEWIKLFSSKLKLRAILCLDTYGMCESDLNNKIYSQSIGNTNYIIVNLGDDGIVEGDFKERKL